MPNQIEHSPEEADDDFDDNEVELVETEAFRLAVDIRRPDLIRWLSAVPKENLELEVERTLAVGNQILTFMQASSGQESMERMFGPIVERMDDLSTLIDRLMGAGGKSQQKGVLGNRSPDPVLAGPA
ncbi:MAG: hypothetical protein KGO50_07675 [Myxococcales bacterium]|nr:hypothetical protein [Myxococcales bacterium]